MPFIEAQSRVRLVGLQSRPELNGRLGVALRFVKEKCRWQVRLDGEPCDSSLALKEENLTCHSEDGKDHEKQGTLSDFNASSSSSSRSPKLLGATSEMQDPCWGGPVLEHERISDRLHRILPVPRKSSYSDRFAKARELFRLGFCLFLEEEWTASSLAIVEGLLLEDKAMPEALAEVNLCKGPESCPFGRLVASLRSEKRLDAKNYDLRVAFLEVHWYDMQMLLARELVERNQDNEEVALEYQQRWFDLLCSMDDLARKAVLQFAGTDAPDTRVLSRLILVQAQYGANPPISRPSNECAKLAAHAVSLWPEDPLARIWCGREEDHEALHKILEPDAPQREKLQLSSGKTNCSQELEEDVDLDGFDFKIAGGGYVVLDGDQTEKSFEQVLESQ